MILNLPLDAIIVEHDFFQGFKIVGAPESTDGIRRKKKLL